MRKLNYTVHRGDDDGFTGIFSHKFYKNGINSSRLKVGKLPDFDNVLFRRQCGVHEDAEISCTAGKQDVTKTYHDR